MPVAARRLLELIQEEQGYYTDTEPSVFALSLLGIALVLVAARGFRYDASGVERDISSPKGNAHLARFALPQIAEGPSGRRIIAMDYNLFVRHSGGFERASESAAFEARAYQAFRGAFDAQYHGKRRNYHASTLYATKYSGILVFTC